VRARILRGAHEIGGSCVELATANSRIVLDVGKPLWAGWDETVPLPAVPGLADGSDPSLVGVVISHPHLDHYGLVDQVDTKVPIFIGKEAAAVLKAAAFFSSAGIELHQAGYLADRAPIKLGDFTVTPYLMDHSAFDSYALLVEAEGKRLFYSGDIRGHGRKKKLFEALVHHPPEGVDVLLCEGTHVRPAGVKDEPPRTEDDVEVSLAERMKATDGAVYVISSAQNIDRLVTVYRARKHAGRILVTDLYTATVAHSTGRSTIPQPGFDDYRVYIPNNQRVRVKVSGEFHRLDLVEDCRVFAEWLRLHNRETTLLLPQSEVPEMLKERVLKDGVVVWSLWPGYLKEASGKRLKKRLKDAGVPLVLDHASGHAPIADLQRLAKALQPKRLVPIHTEGSDRFADLFENVEVHQDGEWWQI
jgi:ribonuclease J